MKSKLDELGEQIKAWTNTAAEKAGDFTRAAAAKAEELSRAGRLKVDIYQLQRERTRLFSDLGRIAYTALEKGNGQALADQPEMANLRQRLAGLNGEIEKKEQEAERASHMAEPPKAKAPAGAKKATGKKPATAQKTTAAKSAGQTKKPTAAGKTSTAKSGGQPKRTPAAGKKRSAKAATKPKTES